MYLNKYGNIWPIGLKLWPKRLNKFNFFAHNFLIIIHKQYTQINSNKIVIHFSQSLSKQILTFLMTQFVSFNGNLLHNIKIRKKLLKINKNGDKANFNKRAKKNKLKIIILVKKNIYKK